MARFCRFFFAISSTYFHFILYLYFISATGVSGDIKVNGKEMSPSSERFRQLLCYIHQDDLLRPQLMVGEIMLMAAHLKLGFKVTKAYKIDLVGNNRKVIHF